MRLYTLSYEYSHSHPSALLTRPHSSQWLLSPCFRSWTHHETRVFTTGSLNNILSPSPNSKTTIYGATTLRPFASPNSSLTTLISSPARLHLLNVIPTVTVIPIPTTLLCSPLLSHCYTTRRQTTQPRKTVLTSKTRLMAFFAK